MHLLRRLQLHHVWILQCCLKVEPCYNSICSDRTDWLHTGELLRRCECVCESQWQQIAARVTRRTQGNGSTVP
jgi:hypothetical protein